MTFSTNMIFLFFVWISSLSVHSHAQIWCNPPPHEQNIVILGIPRSYYSFGERVYYQCSSGILTRGNLQRVCVGFNEWSGQAPVCTSIVRPRPPPVNLPCLRPSNPRNAIVDVNLYQYFFQAESVVSYRCKDGFCSTGDKNIRCVNGQWTQPSANCELCCKLNTF